MRFYNIKQLGRALMERRLLQRTVQCSDLSRVRRRGSARTIAVVDFDHPAGGGKEVILLSDELSKVQAPASDGKFGEYDLNLPRILCIVKTMTMAIRHQLASVRPYGVAFHIGPLV
jgi:hypothetical protein